MEIHLANHLDDNPLPVHYHQLPNVNIVNRNDLQTSDIIRPSSCSRNLNFYSF
ncbi:hypothetical protein MFUM_970097 [Methylacidiphilum fumariolicum SolV]|uniref:Uncharacterized protein n=2 Tax=Candidatus Methylacidiphilum fumarolicum TaxID=591154 RepID=I0K1F7_METFB|nr:conserved protein of unknown function [Candidatus Methylacidiphilum fumarolicum]CCG93326.1 hypothetical protein MFUM_970097 [Methylacidiphilum fumariolicum SolV]